MRHLVCYVSSSLVLSLMVTVYPKKALCGIVNLALVSKVSWSAVSAIALFQLFQRKFPEFAFQEVTPN